MGLDESIPAGSPADLIDIGPENEIRCGFFLVPISQLERRVGVNSTRPMSAYTSREIMGCRNNFLRISLYLEGFISRLEQTG